MTRKKTPSRKSRKQKPVPAPSIVVPTLLSDLLKSRERYLELASFCATPKSRSAARGAATRFRNYMNKEPLTEGLLREVLANEEAYLWYAVRDCGLKGYQWLRASRLQFLKLALVLLATDVGATSIETDEFCFKIQKAVEKFESEIWMDRGSVLPSEAVLAKLAKNSLKSRRVKKS